MKTQQDKLAKTRAEIEALNDEHAETEAAPLPRAEAEARIAAVIDKPWNNQVFDPAPAGLIDGSFGEIELINMIGHPGLLIAVVPDAVKAYLIALYDAEIGVAKPGLPADERRARLAEIKGKIFTLEQDEERLIERLEAEGTDVVRRPEADPRIALGIGSGDAA